MKVSSALFRACTVRFENMCPHVSYSGFCGVFGREILAFEGWPVSGARILSMVDRLLENCSVKLFSYDLHGEEIHYAPKVR